MLAIFLSLWLLINSSLTIQLEASPIRFTDLYGEAREAPAALYCSPEGLPTLMMTSPMSTRVLVHEMAHAWDCIDDGVLNGSPGHQRPEIRPGLRADYCWGLDVEWYACEVVRTRSVE